MKVAIMETYCGVHGQAEDQGVIKAFVQVAGEEVAPAGQVDGGANIVAGQVDGGANIVAGQVDRQLSLGLTWRQPSNNPD